MVVVRLGKCCNFYGIWCGSASRVFPFCCLLSVKILERTSFFLGGGVVWVKKRDPRIPNIQSLVVVMPDGVALL